MAFDPFEFFEMNAPTCQALTALFPLVMITLMLERREMAVPLRRRTWFRKGHLALISVATVGLWLAIWGCQTSGLDGFLALVAWCVVSLAVLGLALTLLASTASAEVREDEPGGSS
jgi:hypothetical protein